MQLARSLVRSLAHGALVAHAALAASACGTAARSPAAPAGGARVTAPDPRPRPPVAAPVVESPPTPDRRGYSAADVAFMQHMIGHHGQALTMSALVPERSRSEAVRTIAERITVSQRDEMAMMRRWLEARHEAVPAEGVADMADMAHAQRMEHMPGMPHGGASGASGASHLMPGMLTGEEMARLAAASGSDFDRLFLQDMIRHHEGALTMVASLFASTGAAQEPELFRLASDVDADQRAEIARMRALLATMTAPR